MQNLINSVDWSTVWIVIDALIKIVAIGTVPEGRRPSSSTAWLLVILFLPVVGLPLFLLMGSPYINRRRHRVQADARNQLQDIHKDTPDYPQGLHPSRPVSSMIQLNRQLTGMPAVVGVNHGVSGDYDRIFIELADAVDHARKYVHVEVYIVSWDKTTDVFFQALTRAAARGVKVRLLLDQIGSWKYPDYRKLGKRLRRAGIDYRLMLPIAPLQARWRRPDLRNHRKLMVIDGERAYMGSLNFIARDYRMKKNRELGRQWADAFVELSGPIVSSIASTFAVDWYMESEEHIELPELPDAPALPAHTGSSSSEANVVQLVPSGPGFNTEPNLRLFNSIIYQARERLILCSPYFIPDESLLDAITTACFRGVEVILLVSEKADQFMVNHAQSSYYQTLLEAGVRIFRFPAPYILHTKFVLADPYDRWGHGDHDMDLDADTTVAGSDALAVFGSSNMDMRSFGLNYELSLFITRGNIIAQLTEMAHSYISVSTELTLEEWNKRGKLRRYIDNVFKLTSAVQ